MMDNNFSHSSFINQSNTEEIERELVSGEKLLWAGRPSSPEWKKEKWNTLGNHLMGFVFSLVWMGIASTSLVQELRAGRTLELFDFVFPVFGLFLIGSALVGLLRLESSRASRTFYGVTNQRALIVVAGKTREVRSFSPHQIQLGRRERDGNIGDVLLNDARLLEKEKPPTSFRLHKTQKSSEESEREVGFFAIENPREVEILIRQKLLDKKV